MRVAIADSELLRRCTNVDAELIEWHLGDPPPDEPFDLLVLPYLMNGARLAQLPAGVSPILQSQSLGYDGVADQLPPGFTYCNAVGVHEASTAELALGLILAARRGISDSVAAQSRGEWAHARQPGLAGAHILIVGAGGVANQLVGMLAPFAVTVTRVARTARVDQYGEVRARDEFMSLLPHADVVVLAVPLDESTRGLADTDFLGAMRDGSLLVNVSRGPVVDTAALLAESGRLRAALDVTDPEPLPPSHPLWSMPGVLITPHVGGDVDARVTNMVRVISEQVSRLSAGLEPANVVVRT